MPRGSQAVAFETVELNESHPLQGLTSKEYQFVQACFSGLNYSDAYRQVYDCRHMSDKSIGLKSSALMQKPLVREKLRELRVEADKKSTLLPALTRDFVTNGIMHLALNAKKETVQLEAYKSLGKISGIDLFRDVTVRETVVRTIEDVDRELRERIAELNKTIEGSARPADDLAPGKRKRAPRA